MNPNDIGYEKKIRKDGLILYQLQWAPYFQCKSKFEVLKSFTEMTGIYLVFVMNKYKRLTPLMIGAAWYTGLRPSILRLYDTITKTSVPPAISDIVSDEKNEIYIKYLEIYDLTDLTHISYALSELYPNIYFDSNGLPRPEDEDDVRIIDNNTKRYYKRS